MVSTSGKRCIYPGCERPAVPPHPLGGPQPSFCDLEEHNALTAYRERQRLIRKGVDPESVNRDPRSTTDPATRPNNEEMHRG
jgi:hypothetical protein